MRLVARRSGRRLVRLVLVLAARGGVVCDWYERVPAPAHRLGTGSQATSTFAARRSPPAKPMPLVPSATRRCKLCHGTRFVHTQPARTCDQYLRATESRKRLVGASPAPPEAQGATGRCKRPPGKRAGHHPPSSVATSLYRATMGACVSRQVSTVTPRHIVRLVRVLGTQTHSRFGDGVAHNMISIA